MQFLSLNPMNIFLHIFCSNSTDNLSFKYLLKRNISTGSQYVVDGPWQNRSILLKKVPALERLTRMSIPKLGQPCNSEQSSRDKSSVNNVLSFSVRLSPSCLPYVSWPVFIISLLLLFGTQSFYSQTLKS